MRWFDVEDAERAEQEAYEKQMQTMYDEQCRMQELTEEAEWLNGEVKRLKAENEVLRGERAAVVAWLRDVVETMNHNGDKCCGRVEDLADAIERGEHRREEGKRLTDAVAEDRAALVAWLRDGGAPLTRGDYEMILRGEHRREEER